jgi:hypothetical protein
MIRNCPLNEKGSGLKLTISVFWVLVMRRRWVQGVKYNIWPIVWNVVYGVNRYFKSRLFTVLGKKHLVQDYCATVISNIFVTPHEDLFLILFN